MSKRLCFVIFLLGLTVFVSAGPPQNGPQSKKIELAYDQLSAPIELSADTMAVIKLPANPSTGYQWEVLNSAEAGAILMELSIQDGEGRVELEYEAALIASPGAPVNQVLRFVGVQQGDTELVLAYRRPWENSIAEIRRVPVYSQGAFNGILEIPRAKHPKYTPPRPEETIMAGLPAHFNWAEQGKVTPVRNQGNCGSCWAFGTCAVFEAKMLIKEGVSRDLSEQYLVSCNCDGWSCSGGWWAHDYHYNKYCSPNTAAGARYESDFAYCACNAACKVTPAHEKLAGWAYVDDVPDTAQPSLTHNPTVAQIKQKIYDYGPVGTVVDCYSWGSYTGGVWVHTGSSLNHIVCITGWDDTAGCWYIKNSWGTGWGESGYMRLAYGSDLAGIDSTYVKYMESSPPTPAAPSNLQAEAECLWIFLSWQDNSSNEQGFKIERKSVPGTTWVQFKTVGPNVTQYEYQLPCGNAYYYRVRAYNASGNSAYSNSSYATTIPCGTSCNAP